MKRIFIKTFGCRSNFYDSEIIKNKLENYEIVDKEEDAELIIINSCTVTNFADRDLRKYINRFSDKEIILTGCAAYTEGDKLYNSQKVKSVLGHKFKETIHNYLNFKGIKLGDFNFINSSIVDQISRNKAFIKIQEGCNFDCAYCIIPSVRGPSRSMDENFIIEQIKLLAENGVKEIVLTGINMGSYGEDINSNLTNLLKKIEDIRGIKRVRLGSLEPTQITDELVEMAINSKLEKHLHIALQHTSDRMLRIMRRRNRFKSSLKLFEKLASKNIALGTDFIVGHPGEEEDVWEEALTNFKLFPLTHIHVFRFTPKDNTLSSTMKNSIQGNIVKERAKILQNIVDNNNFEFRKKQNSIFVHVESFKDGFYEGFDQFYNKLKIKSNIDLTGNWLKVDNYKVKRDCNYAE